MTPYPIRLQALDWLFDAARLWLFQGEEPSEGFPHREGVDWKAVGDLAYVHNLEPLLFWVISNRNNDADVPPWLKEKWEEAYFQTFLSNEERLHTLKTFLDQWHQEGISVIVLKGPALIGRIYKDPALRPMSDLDILCSKRDIGRLIDTVRKAGYRTGGPGDDPAGTPHIAMYRPDTGSMLEFHFRPYDTIKNHSLFMNTAWEQREWIDVNRISCPVLSLDMELLLDLAHLAHHQFDLSLKHVIDMAGLLVFCREQFHWDEIDVRLREFGLEGVFELSAGFIAHTFHLPWGEKENAAQTQFNASLRQLLGLLDLLRLMDVQGVFRGFLAALQQQEGFRAKLAFIRNRSLPFLDAAAPSYEIASGGDIFPYYVRRFLFYCQRFLLTLAHLRGTSGADPESLAVQRAVAKNRITRLLVSV